MKKKTPPRRVGRITDAQRLEFVSRHWITLENGRGLIWPGHNCTRYGGQTFREAIDAAIKSSTKPRGGKR